MQTRFPNLVAAHVKKCIALPSRATDHQGLYLSIDGDQLLGRADNGTSSGRHWHVYCVSDVVSFTNTVLLTMKGCMVHGGGQGTECE